MNKININNVYKYILTYKMLVEGCLIEINKFGGGGSKKCVPLIYINFIICFFQLCFFDK